MDHLRIVSNMTDWLNQWEHNSMRLHRMLTRAKLVYCYRLAVWAIQDDKRTTRSEYL